MLDSGLMLWLPRSHSINPLSNIYQAGCGRWLSMVILNEERQLAPLLQTLGLAHLQGDPRLATAASREAHCVDIVAQFDAAFAEHDLPSWRRRLDAAGITFGVVGTLADIDSDAQMRAAGALVSYGHRAGTTVAAPILLHGSTPRPPGPAPALGEHSATLLAEAGYSDDQIAHLLHSGIVQ